MKNVCVLGAISFAVATSSWAKSDGDRPIQVLYKDAQAVVSATVISMKASCAGRMPYCRPEYILKLDGVRDIKALVGKAPSAGMTVCTAVMLEVGSSYTLFLERPDKYNSVSAEKCNFAIDRDGVFLKKGSYTYRVGSPDATIIVDFEGDKYFTNAVVEPDFEQAMDSLAGRKGAGEKGPE